MYVHCRLCHALVLMMGRNNDGHQFDIDDDNGDSFIQDVSLEPYSWLSNVLIIHDGGIIDAYDDDGKTNYRLYSKDNADNLISYDTDDSVFLHRRCLNLIITKINKKDLDIDTSLVSLEDVSECDIIIIELMFQNESINPIIDDLFSHYDIAYLYPESAYPCDYYNHPLSNEKTRYADEDERNYIWILKDPMINKKNNNRICNNLNLVYETMYMWLFYKDFMELFIDFAHTKNLTDVINYIIPFITSVKFLVYSKSITV